MWAGVVPQQPPTIVADPSSQPVKASGKRAGSFDSSRAKPVLGSGLTEIRRDEKRCSQVRESSPTGIHVGDGKTVHTDHRRPEIEHRPSCRLRGIRRTGGSRRPRRRSSRRRGGRCGRPLAPPPAPRGSCSSSRSGSGRHRPRLTGRPGVRARRPASGRPARDPVGSSPRGAGASPRPSGPGPAARRRRGTREGSMAQAPWTSWRLRRRGGRGRRRGESVVRRRRRGPRARGSAAGSGRYWP